MYHLKMRKGIVDGMLVTNIKVDEKNEKAIITREKVKFDENKKGEYIKKFKKFKSQGIIENNSFYDNTWTIKIKDDGYEDNKIFKFEFENRPAVNQALKFFCLEKLTNRIDLKTIHRDIVFIKKALFESSFFNEDNYYDFEDYVFGLTQNVQMKFRDAIFAYLSFLSESIPEEYNTFLLSISNADRNIRILPDYRSIVYFDYLIDKFIKEAPNSLRYKFYPIILWWKITSLIPMRPIEFTRLKREDCFYKDGKYYLLVTRAKPHSFLEKAMGLRKEQVLRVNKEIYDFVYEYTHLSNNHGDYLLSYNSLKEFYQDRGFRGNYELIPRHLLDALLDEFYEDVIGKMYEYNCFIKKEVANLTTRTIDKITGNNLVKLNLGDTRHLAIINLIIQGCNPYTIKELAGHRDINSFIHYGNHIEKYIESKTVLMTDNIRSEINSLEKGFKPVKFSNKREEKARELLYRDQMNQNGVLKVKEGLCFRYIDGKTELFPSLCIPTCKDCDFILRDSNKLSIEKLENEVKAIDDKINMQIEIIQYYLNNAVKKRLVDMKTGKVSAETHRNLKTSSNLLDDLVRQKSKVESYKLILKEVRIE